MSPSEKCIDVAVDHRLRRLIGIVPSPQSSLNGNHCNLLRELAQSITRPNEDISPEEVEFTAWLSQPASTGGVVAMLQQPSNNHPYDRGREMTFLSCDTLVALDQCFKFASCGTMGLDNITAIDDLPYTRKKDTTTPEYRRAIRSHVGNIIYAKRPSVILCMSQEKEEIPSPTALLKSLGIGKTFRDPIIRLGTDHYAKRINAFHPSYALYHRMNDSAFRQLLLLEVTRTCGELRGDWKEEGWMQDLRRDCQAKARQAQSDVRVQLMSSLEAIKSLLIELLSVEKDSARAISRLLMNMRASEHCNDASLCLSDIDARYGAIHPDDRDDDLVSLAAFTVSACKDFLVRVLRGIKGTQLLLANRRAQATGIYTKESVHSVTRTSSAALTGRMQLGDDIQLFLQNLNGSFTWTHAGTRSCAAIEELSRLFLSLAIAFEAQLGRLTLASSGNQIPNPSTEQDLALDFSRLTVR